MTRAAPRDDSIAVRCVDLVRSFSSLDDVRDYARVRVFVTARGALLGQADIDNGHEPVSASRLQDAVVDAVAETLLESILVRHLAPAEPSTLGADVSASIVVVAGDRAHDLRACLGCLVSQASRRTVEVIVVAGQSVSSSTRAVVAEFPDILLLSAEHGGRAHALNKGFLASSGDIIATTAEDVTMADTWLDTLLSPFVDAEVMAVTGSVLPLELDTRAQRLFDAYAATTGRRQRREVDSTWFREFVSAAPTWELGGTTNGAFRASIFRDAGVGLADEALGPGTPAGSGEDEHLLYKILASGGRIVHEPAAHVWRRPPRDMRELRRLVYRHGKGHVACQLTTLLAHGDRRALVRLLLKLPWTHARRAADRVRGRTNYPLYLIAAEVAGNVGGPLALWRSRRRLDPSRGTGAGGGT